MSTGRIGTEGGDMDLTPELTKTLEKREIKKETLHLLLNALNNDPCHQIMIHLSLQEKILITKVTSLLWNRTTAPHHPVGNMMRLSSNDNKQK